MKTLATILLFLATLIVFGQDKFQTELLKYANQNVNLTTGIQVIIPAKQSYMDFSKMDKSQFPIFTNTSSINDKEWMGGFDTNGFYNIDFSEMPFDGKIQVLVVGEPLPTQTVSLVLGMLTVLGIIWMKKNKEQVYQ